MIYFLRGKEYLLELTCFFFSLFTMLNRLTGSSRASLLRASSRFMAPARVAPYSSYQNREHQNSKYNYWKLGGAALVCFFFSNFCNYVVILYHFRDLVYCIKVFNLFPLFNFLLM